MKKAELREYMKKIGRKGGHAAAATATPLELRQRGQAGGKTRWKNHTAARRPRRLAMTDRLRAKHDFPGSLYLNVCPLCGARPFEWCVSLGGVPRAGKAHSQRGTKPTPKPFRRVKP